MNESEAKPFVKIVYDDGEGTRALRGVIESDTPDGLFLIVVRPNGDRAWIAKSAVRAVIPVPFEERP